MAAVSGLDHIFGKPVTENQAFLESLSPWKRNGTSAIDDSFTELFGELHFRETETRSSSFVSSGRADTGATNISPGPGPSPGRRKQGAYSDSFSSMSSESLSLCTEGLGFESSDEVETGDELGGAHLREGGGKCPAGNSKGRHCVGKELRGDLPPPIPGIGKNGKPWVCFQSVREGGRFILKEIRMPTKELMQARREDGRLRLQYVHSDDDDGDSE
ncbi:Protein of unknown function (DUF3049 [Striga hermonthica]|uniref:FAF domain-containing protein n=1 Tax=Striga hermonthica TaxID=68872 RepID=A0A9N7MN88_STRHE|nr:Protein of unknown function (DUF3049 [Striga hermonthica]